MLWKSERFFDRLDYLLKKKGWSIFKLSLEAELSETLLYVCRKRKTTPSLITINKTCIALNITMSEFFNDGQEAKYSNTDDLFK